MTLQNDSCVKRNKELPSLDEYFRYLRRSTHGCGFKDIEIKKDFSRIEKASSLELNVNHRAWNTMNNSKNESSCQVSTCKSVY